MSDTYDHECETFDLYDNGEEGYSAGTIDDKSAIMILDSGLGLGGEDFDRAWLHIRRKIIKKGEM